MGRSFFVLRIDAQINVYKIHNLELITTFEFVAPDHICVKNDFISMLNFKRDLIGRLIHPKACLPTLNIFEPETGKYTKYKFQIKKEHLDAEKLFMNVKQIIMPDAMTLGVQTSIENKIGFTFFRFI